MIIESVEKYKGETLCVTMEDGRKVFLHRDLVHEYNLVSGIKLTENQLDEVVYASDLRRAKRRAMYLINEREYSYIGLYQKLEQNYPEEICSDVMDYMAKNGYVNDKRYAKQLAYKYIECKCYGPRRAVLELTKKGITRKVAGEVVEEYSEGMYERLDSVVERKYAEYLDDPKDYKSINKVKSALVRLGYNFEDINSIVEEYLYDE